MVPLDDEELAKLPHQVSPLLQLEGLNFRRNIDLCRGAWRNFFIGVSGDVGPAEEDVLWPNQVVSHNQSRFSTPFVSHLGPFC